VLSWDEEPSREPFTAGDSVFLRNWSYVYKIAQDKSASSVVGTQFRRNGYSRVVLCGPGIYSIWERGEHVLNDGPRMVGVWMRKSLMPRH
jgi:hypothetical protein